MELELGPWPSGRPTIRRKDLRFCRSYIYTYITSFLIHCIVIVVIRSAICATFGKQNVNESIYTLMCIGPKTIRLDTISHKACNDSRKLDSPKRILNF